ncbi:hypothetical protein IV203_001509 [Nitzschia inconspicua]|uniref:Uncharacterized protein n=1 Tax=Nitzschia inconspicua TaxID=303405 RepID=A0A9K3L8M6_9STRA|nr:hypothetical protein IV203_001509 [Nitzschia inconspicua]
MCTSKLFLISLATLFMGGAAQCSGGCTDTLTAAQLCLRECVNKGPVAEWGGAVDFQTNGASRLWQCLPGNGKLPQFTNPDPLTDLMGCCEMTAACNQTMIDAQTCSKNNCLPPCIKRSAQRYTNCIVRQSQARVCNFAGLCVGQLTGNDAFDFAQTLSGAADRVTETSCSPLDSFVDGICGISDRCCDDCNANMATLASCLVNRLLLPNSNSGGSVACQISTPVGEACAITGASAVSVGRVTDNGDMQNNSQVDNLFPDENSAQVDSLFPDEEEEVVALDDADISECEEVLTFTFLVHNETHAVDQFMSCMGKKVGQIIAKSETMDDTTPSQVEASSPVSLYGSMALFISSLLAALAL